MFRILVLCSEMMEWEHSGSTRLSMYIHVSVMKPTLSMKASGRKSISGS